MEFDEQRLNETLRGPSPYLNLDWNGAMRLMKQGIACVREKWGVSYPWLICEEFRCRTSGNLYWPNGNRMIYIPSEKDFNAIDWKAIDWGAVQVLHPNGAYPDNLRCLDEG